MPFIPSPYLMTLPLRRQENDEEKMKKQKNRAILKDENEKKEKIEKPHYPSKCKKCDYRFYNHCNEKNEDITKMDESIINECREKKKLKNRRKLLKKAKWTPINKALLKILLLNEDPYSTSTFIYENFEMCTSNFEVWEIFAILAFSEEPPLFIGKTVKFKNYSKMFPRYLKYIEEVQDGKLEPVENKQLPTDNACDYATLILLKNFLFHFKDNENAQLLQEMLTRESTIDDINTAVTLLLEENLLNKQSNKEKNKVKSINNIN